MPKLLVRVRRMLCQLIFWLDRQALSCIKRYRVPIIGILHPISASVLLISVGFFVVYEMVYILPELCSATSLFYRINCVLAIFLLHNIIGNMIYCWLTDASCLALAKDRLDPLPADAHLWHLCTHCQMLVPPRAWHCRLCNCCILKRDHHCNVTANCIGHANQRYFVGMLLYLTVGGFVSCIYNVVHMWCRHHVLNESFLYFGLANGESALEENMQWLLINGIVLKLNLFCVFLAGAHLALQLFMILRGSCMYAFRDRSFDFGTWHNLRLVLGERWLWALLSPFANSALPQDGTQWQFKSDSEAKKPA